MLTGTEASCCIDCAAVNAVSSMKSAGTQAIRLYSPGATCAALWSVWSQSIASALDSPGPITMLGFSGGQNEPEKITAPFRETFSDASQLLDVSVFVVEPTFFIVKVPVTFSPTAYD